MGFGKKKRVTRGKQTLCGSEMSLNGVRACQYTLNLQAGPPPPYTQLLEAAGLTEKQATNAYDALFGSTNYCIKSNDESGTVIYTNESGGQLRIGDGKIGGGEATLNIPNNTKKIPGFGTGSGITLDNIDYPPLPLELKADDWLFDDLSGKGAPQYFPINLKGSTGKC